MFERSSMPEAWPSVLISERVLALSALDSQGESAVELFGGPDASGETMSAQDYRNVRKFWAVLGMMMADRRLMLETYEQTQAVAKIEWPERHTLSETVLQGFESQVRRFPPKLFSGMLLGSLLKAETKFASFEARRRSAITAIAVERYRQVNQGTLPERLEELVPKFLPNLLADPFWDWVAPFQEALRWVCDLFGRRRSHRRRGHRAWG